MKSLKKRLVTLGIGLAVMATSAMSLTASALEYDDWPAYYTPYSGKFYAGTTSIQVDNLKWSASQLDTIRDNLGHGLMGVEFEFRPKENDGVTSLNPKTIWTGKSGNGMEISNMPLSYAEFDKDDVSIGCGYVSNCNDSTVYYGVLYLNPAENAPANPRYILECELGIGLHGVDYWPLRCCEYRNTVTRLGSNYSWLN